MEKSSMLEDDCQAKIQTEIELQQILIKQNSESSFLSLESEIIIEKAHENGTKEILATLKIDLHDLALSDHFHEVKNLTMNSPFSKDAWIGITISEIFNMEVSKEEVTTFGYNNFQVLAAQSDSVNKQALEKMSDIEEKRLVARKKKKRIRYLENFQSIVKIVDGKDLIIAQLEEKIILLIDVLAQTKKQLKRAEKVVQDYILLETQKFDRSKQADTGKLEIKRDFSLNSFRSLPLLPRQPSSVHVKSHTKLPSDRCKISNEQMDCVTMENELKEKVEQLQKQNKSLKQKIKITDLELSELKEAKYEIYQSKKKNILISEENQMLNNQILELQFKVDHLLFTQSLTKVRTQKDQRLQTCVSVNQQNLKLSIELLKVRENAMKEEIQRMRIKIREGSLETINLKRSKTFVGELLEKDSSKRNDVENLLKGKILELTTKFAGAEQQYRATILKLQQQVSILTQEKRNIERQHSLLLTKYDYTKEMYDKMKEIHNQDQKKHLSYTRLQIKNKELDDFNKKLQQTIQRQENELRERHKQLLQFSYNRFLTSSNKLERGFSFSTIDNDRRKLFTPSTPFSSKKIELRNSIKDLQNVIKQHKGRMDQSYSLTLDPTEINQTALKDLQEKMKEQMDELNNLEEEPPTPPTRNDLGTRWQVQQIIQQNNELKAYIRDLLKKVITLQTMTPTSKLNLDLKQRDINEKQKKLMQNIEDICMEVQLQNSTNKQNVLSIIDNIKQLVTEQMKVVERQLIKIVQHEAQVAQIESNLAKRELKMNIDQMSKSQKLAAILPQNKWKESQLMEYSEMKKKEKDLKIKISNLQSRILSDRMQLDKQKQDLIKKHKDQQKRMLAETKESNEKQMANWKNEMSELEKKLREKDIESQELKHNIQMSKTTLENEQRMGLMKISEYNLKTDDFNHSLEKVEQQLKNEVMKNRASLETMKALNSDINKLTSIVQSKQAELTQLNEQYRQFREQSEDLLAQMETKYEQMLKIVNEEKGALTMEMDRLRTLIEDEVVKSIKFEEEYKVICNTANELEMTISELNLTLEKKENIIQKMTSHDQLRIQQIKVMEDQYNNLLSTLEEESHKYASLKGEYTSLELMYEKVEEFVRDLQGAKEQDRKKFQEILDGYDKEKRNFITQINELLRMSGQKDIEYQKSVHEYQLHIMRLEEMLEQEKINSKRLSQELERLMKENEELKRQIAALIQQLDSRQERKDKDIGKKKKKVGLLDMSYCEKPGGQQRQFSRMYEQDHHNLEQLLPPPVSKRDKGTAHLGEAASNFIYPTTHKSNKAISLQNPPQIRIIDENGEDIGRRSPPSRSLSMKKKMSQKMSQKVENQEDVPVEQVLEKQLKQYFKKYERSSNNSSDDEQVWRDEQINSLCKTLDYLNKELTQKKGIIKKNQIEMSETKRLLQVLFKRKKQLKRDASELTPSLSRARLQIDIQIEDMSDSLKQIELVTQYLDSLQEQINILKQVNIKYGEEIRQMDEELGHQELENSNAGKIIAQQESQIAEIKCKGQKLRGEIQNLLEDIRLKSGLIVQFQEIIRSKEEEGELTKKIIEELQGELEEEVILRYKIEAGLEEVNEKLLTKDNQLYNVTSLKEDLLKKFKELNGELSQLQQEEVNKNATIVEKQEKIKQLQEAIESLQNDIEHVAEKYLLMEDHIKTNRSEFEQFEIKLAEKSQKHEDALKRLIGTERQKGLLELKVKEVEGQISLKDKLIVEKDDEIRELSKEMIIQNNTFEKERNAISDILKQLEDELKSKDLNIELLKKDVEIFLSENRKLKEQQEKILQEAQASDEKVKILVESFQNEIQNQKNTALSLKGEIKQLHLVINQQKAEIEQLNQIQKLRGDLVEQVQRNNRSTTTKVGNELKLINEEIQKRMELKLQETRFKYQEKLALKDGQYNKLKIVYDRQIKNIEQQRYEMFSRKCQLQQTRIQMAEKEDVFRTKIKKYKGSIKEICGKLKNMENERPHVEMFEQIVFQNEIFKNKIAELEENVTSKERISIDYHAEEIEQMKAKFTKERQQYLNQLENYSAHVSELEEKNYQLSSQLKQKRYEDCNELRQENMQLEKSIIRLETCEQQLRTELQLLKHKREEEYKQYLADLRALKKAK